MSQIFRPCNNLLLRGLIYIDGGPIKSPDGLLNLIQLTAPSSGLLEPIIDRLPPPHSCYPAIFLFKKKLKIHFQSFVNPTSACWQVWGSEKKKKAAPNYLASAYSIHSAAFHKRLPPLLFKTLKRWLNLISRDSDRGPVEDNFFLEHNPFGWRRLNVSPAQRVRPSTFSLANRRRQFGTTATTPSKKSHFSPAGSKPQLRRSINPPSSAGEPVASGWTFQHLRFPETTLKQILKYYRNSSTRP